MANCKHTTDQILAKLREVDMMCRKDMTILEAVKCVEISEKTYYRWRKKYGWMTVDEYHRMEQLEAENMKLKALIQLWVQTLGTPGASLEAEEAASRSQQVYG